MLVYNVHSLIHIVNDVRRYGCLDNISAVPFENYLGKLKKKIRRPQNPIAQIMRRLSERQHTAEIRASAGRDITGSADLHKKPHMSGPLPRECLACLQYKQYCGLDSFMSSSVGIIVLR